MFDEAAQVPEEIEPEKKTRNEVLGARVNLHMAAKKWDMAEAVASHLVKIYLSVPGGNSQEVELSETPGWGNLVIHFSPDDYWLIVQDGGPSLGISLRLFRRDKGVIFRKQKDADIDGKAERLALKLNGFGAQEILDHRYVKVLAWSRDSTCVLIALRGHGGTRKQAVTIENWIGVYDLASGDVGFDIGKMNRRPDTPRWPSVLL